MVRYPDVQRRARAEIHAVVGTERLPTFEDRARLPYVDALVKEVLRWNCVAPLGLAHRATEDVVWGEYVIPAGACTVIEY